jgi:hypothetical protein
LHGRVRAFVPKQLERAIDEALDIPSLHADFIEVGHGRLDPAPDAIREIVKDLPTLRIAI